MNFGPGDTIHTLERTDEMSAITVEQIDQIATALAKAQGELVGAIKDAANPHFKSRYADLASVWEACRSALSRNGLAVVQMPSTGQGCVHITTVLMHSSGQSLRDTLAIPVAKLDAQGIGSAITYGRRYALAAFVGVAPEDDDGEGAVGRQAEKPDNAAWSAPWLAKFAAAQTEPELMEIGKAIHATLPPKHSSALRPQFDARLKEIRGAA